MLKRVNYGRGLFLLIILALTFLSSQVAAASVNLKKSIQQCAEIAIAQQRLVCFDQLAQPLVKSSATLIVDVAVQDTSVAVKTERIQEQVKAQEIDNFAKEHLEKKAQKTDGKVNHIELTISKLKKLIRGEWKITFTNGQQWQQKDGARITLKVGGKVILEKGTLGVIYLKKTTSHQRIKVKRLK